MDGQARFSDQFAYDASKTVRIVRCPQVAQSCILRKSLCKASLTTMARTSCNDRVVGAILASWRYDISGISPEMRKDYEGHLVDCHCCSSRQKFHRGLDVALLVLTSLSMFFSVFALAVLKHVKPLEHVA